MLTNERCITRRSCAVLLTVAGELCIACNFCWRRGYTHWRTQAGQTPTDLVTPNEHAFGSGHALVSIARGSGRCRRHAQLDGRAGSAWIADVPAVAYRLARRLSCVRWVSYCADTRFHLH